MISITAVPAGHLLNPSDSAESESSTQRKPDTGAQVEGAESGALSAMNSVVPPGGLHPIAPGPGTALFGFITDAMRAAIETSNHPAEPPPPTSGDGPDGGCFNESWLRAHNRDGWC